MDSSANPVQFKKKSLPALAYDVSRLEHSFKSDNILLTRFVNPWCSCASFPPSISLLTQSYAVLRHAKTLDLDTTTAIRLFLLYFRTIRHTAFPRSTWQAYKEVICHLDRWMDDILRQNSDSDFVLQIV